MVSGTKGRRFESCRAYHIFNNLDRFTQPGDRRQRGLLFVSPAHALLLATASGFDETYQHVVEEVDSSNKGPVDALVKADMVYFEYPNGGAVFSVGSISWNGALSYDGYNNTVARITNNVLKRFASDEQLPNRSP